MAPGTFRRPGRSSWRPGTTTTSSTAPGIVTTLGRPVRIMVALDWVTAGPQRRLAESLCAAAGWPVVLRPDADRYRPELAADPVRRAAYRADTTRYLKRAAGQSVELLRRGEALLVFPEGYPNIDPSFTPKSERTDDFLPMLPGRGPDSPPRPSRPDSHRSRLSPSACTTTGLVPIAGRSSFGSAIPSGWTTGATPRRPSPGSTPRFTPCPLRNSGYADARRPSPQTPRDQRQPPSCNERKSTVISGIARSLRRVLTWARPWKGSQSCSSIRSRILL